LIVRNGRSTVGTDRSSPVRTKVPPENVRVKRVYQPPAADDGVRILVDRVWPRGVTREAAAVDEWMKDIAPSAELRRWFGHDPVRWEEFCLLYAAELRQRDHSPLDDLRSRVRNGRTTLVFSARDEERNNAVALRELLLHGR
jgi:uncharacterized protein YeaO (DUF488 family)